MWKKEREGKVQNIFDLMRRQSGLDIEILLELRVVVESWFFVTPAP